MIVTGADWWSVNIGVCIAMTGQCWPSYLSPYGVTRPQWVNSLLLVMLYDECKLYSPVWWSCHMYLQAYAIFHLMYQRWTNCHLKWVSISKIIFWELQTERSHFCNSAWFIYTCPSIFIDKCMKYHICIYNYVIVKFVGFFFQVIQWV